MKLISMLVWITLLSGNTDMCIITSDAYQDDYVDHVVTLMCIDKALYIYDEGIAIASFDVWDEKAALKCNCTGEGGNYDLQLNK